MADPSPAVLVGHDEPSGPLRRPTKARRLRRALVDWATSSRIYLMLLGFSLVLAFWHVTTAVVKLPMFEKITPPLTVLREWFTLYAALL